VTLAGGVATFSGLSYNKAETINLQFSTSAGGFTATSTSIAVSAAAATQFADSVSGSFTAGNGLLLEVTAQDPFGNTDHGYGGTAHFTSSDAQASLPADSMLTNGTGAFVAVLKTAGTQTITATDTVSSSITGTTGPLSITPAAANHLAFGVQPSNIITEHVITPAVTVRVLDFYGNLVSSDSTDQVTLGIASGPGGFSASSTTTAQVSGGIATFSNLVLITPGSYTLSEFVPQALTGLNSTAFTVAPLLITSFVPTSTGFTATFNEPFKSQHDQPLRCGHCQLRARRRNPGRQYHRRCQGLVADRSDQHSDHLHQDRLYFGGRSLPQ
jgi:hypothetical protein